jgi:hypothetical protein
LPGQSKSRAAIAILDDMQSQCIHGNFSVEIANGLFKTLSVIKMHGSLRNNDNKGATSFVEFGLQ